MDMALRLLFALTWWLVLAECSESHALAELMLYQPDDAMACIGFSYPNRCLGWDACRGIALYSYSIAASSVGLHRFKWLCSPSQPLSNCPEGRARASIRATDCSRHSMFPPLSILYYPTPRSPVLLSTYSCHPSTPYNHLSSPLNSATMVAISVIKESNANVLPSALPSGLVAVFLGATSGIGQATLKQFIVATKHKSPRVYVVGRSASAVYQQLADLRQLNPSATIEFVEQDVSLVRNVDPAVNQIKQRETKVDLLFLSVGFVSVQGRIGTCLFW